MAVKQILVSDISGKDIPDGEAVRVVISDHPAISGTVEIDAAASEIAALQSKQLQLVSIAIHSGVGAPRRVVMEASDFGKALKGVDVDTLLRSARRVTGEARSKSGNARQSTGPKRDYSSPEWAGVEHRGRVTEAEAAWVRENLEAANANREREGYPPIDVKDPKMKKRYGLK